MSKRRTRFGTWCKRDENDETKIFYTFRMKNYDGMQEVKHFTSDDGVPASWLTRLYYAWIESIERKEEGWQVSIYEE